MILPTHTPIPVVALAVVCKVAKDRLLVGKSNRDRVLPDDLEDFSRFEGEGGPEAPSPATELIDVPLDNAIWRRPRRAAQQANQKPITR